MTLILTEKSLVWDEIVAAKLFKEFKQEPSEPITLVANKACLEGLMEKSAMKGLNKAIPNKMSCYFLKH